MRAALAVWWIVPIICFGFGGWGIYETLIQFPRDYSVLEERGVRRTASFAGCTSGIGGEPECLLRLSSGRAPWDYEMRHSQFDGLSPGDRVEVVIDPRDPSRRYTASDVRRRTDAGVGVRFGFSVAMVLGGVVAVVAMRRATSSFT